MIALPLPAFLRRQAAASRRAGDPAVRRDRQRRARRARPDASPAWSGALDARLRAQARAGGGAADQQPWRLAGPVGADRRPHPALADEKQRRCWPSSRTSRPRAATGSPAPPTRSSPMRPRSWARSAWSAPASAFRRRSPGSASSGGCTPPAQRKALLDPFRPERPDDLDLLRGIQGDILARFIEHVRGRRGDRLKGADDELFDGRVWTGDAALELGLIDGLGEARATIRARYGDEAQAGRRSTRSVAGCGAGCVSGRSLHICWKTCSRCSKRAPSGSGSACSRRSVGRDVHAERQQDPADDPGRHRRMAGLSHATSRCRAGWLPPASARAASAAPAAKATDLVECARCGLFVPNGTICRSREECRFRQRLNRRCSP